jgi:hypothetical protein
MEMENRCMKQRMEQEMPDRYVCLLGDVLVRSWKNDDPKYCVYVLWDCESAYPVYIGITTAWLATRIWDHRWGGRSGQSKLGKYIEAAEPYSWDWKIELYQSAYWEANPFNFPQESQEQLVGGLRMIEHELIREKHSWLNSQPRDYPPEGTERPWWYFVIIEPDFSEAIAERLRIK